MNEKIKNLSIILGTFGTIIFGANSYFANQRVEVLEDTLWHKLPSHITYDPYNKKQEVENYIYCSDIEIPQRLTNRLDSYFLELARVSDGALIPNERRYTYIAHLKPGIKTEDLSLLLELRSNIVKIEQETYPSVCLDSNLSVVPNKFGSEIVFMNKE